jgi:hypothetical protein
MKIINIHQRTINQPKVEIEKLFKTLATKNDLVVDTAKWPPMILDNGIQVGSKGGHGPMKYTVEEFVSGELIKFRFTAPKGFEGFHKIEFTEVKPHFTELKHTIDTNINGFALLTYPLAIRWLHDAFIEDAFDKVENNFTTKKKVSEWSIWVKFLRKISNPKRNTLTSK